MVLPNSTLNALDFRMVLDCVQKSDKTIDGDAATNNRKSGFVLNECLQEFTSFNTWSVLECEMQDWVSDGRVCCNRKCGEERSSRRRKASDSFVQRIRGTFNFDPQISRDGRLKTLFHVETTKSSSYRPDRRHAIDAKTLALFKARRRHRSKNHDKTFRFSVFVRSFHCQITCYRLKCVDCN